MVELDEKMLVNKGEEEFEEGVKAKKPVKPTKANMKKATVLLVLMIENRFLKSIVTVVPPLIGVYFAVSAMERRSLIL